MILKFDAWSAEPEEETTEQCVHSHGKCAAVFKREALLYQNKGH